MVGAGPWSLEVAGLLVCPPALPAIQVTDSSPCSSHPELPRLGEGTK